MISKEIDAYCRLKAVLTPTEVSAVSASGDWFNAKDALLAEFLGLPEENITEYVNPDWA